MNAEDHPAAASGAKREKLNVQPYDLVPFQEMTEAYVRVAEFGAKKYEPWNWSKGLSRVQIIGSLLRHTFAYLRGKDYDDGPKGSGLLHTDHILWNAAALTHNVHWGLEDGRRSEPPRDYKNSTDAAMAEPAPVSVIIEHPFDIASFIDAMNGSESFPAPQSHAKSDNHGEG